MSNPSDYERYMRALFREGDGVCATNSPTGYRVEQLGDVLYVAGSSTPQAFVAINPISLVTDNFPIEEWHRADLPRRADHNVTSHRNFLFEFDKGTIDEQMKEIVDKELPYTSLVYSGGKSLHAVISLTEGIPRDLYDELWQTIHYVMWKADPTSKNPSRLTRAGGATRDNGVHQELIDLRQPVTFERLVTWLRRFERHIERCQARDAAKAAERQAKVKDAGGMSAISRNTREFLNGDNSSTKGSSRHTRLVAVTHELHEVGVEYDEALSVIGQACEAHGITLDPKRANEAESIVNYVYGKRRP